MAPIDTVKRDGWGARLPLRYKLVFLVGTATSAVFAIHSWQTIQYFNSAILEATEQASVADSNELRGVLEEQMLTEDRGTLTRLVPTIGRSPGVSWVGLVDVNGTVKLSSEAGAALRRLPEESAERLQLALWRGILEPTSVTLMEPSGVLRTMTPLPNAPVCQQCHSSVSNINGMLIVDRSLGPLRRILDASERRLALGGVVLVALLLGILGLVVERNVLWRVERLRTATRSLGSGQLTARAYDANSDELGDLARDFNDMAQKLEVSMQEARAPRPQLEEKVNCKAHWIVLLDVTRRVVTVNRACAARLGGAFPEPGVAYRDLALRAGIEMHENSPLPAERALHSGALEKEVVRAAHGDRTEELYAQPLRSPEGQIVAVIEVWRDITDRRELEAGLEHSERLASIGVLASSVAHEVGNPLASIITAVDGLLSRLAMGEEAKPAEIREYLEIVRRQVFRCHEVTKRLLGFARLPGGGQVVVDVAAAGREVLSLVAQEARRQQVQFTLQAVEPALASAPDMMVEQVFLNLVLNALKAMPSGGTLQVDIRGDSDSVVASFCDSGSGISEAVRKHLFQPFRRAKQDRSGTGLGLFISQTLIARAGGSIEVESVPGRGTTFRVRMRRAVPGGMASAVEPPRKTGS